jgi:hypothetical protein
MDISNGIFSSIIYRLIKHPAKKEKKKTELKCISTGKEVILVRGYYFPFIFRFYFSAYCRSILGQNVTDHKWIFVSVPFSWVVLNQLRHLPSLGASIATNYVHGRHTLLSDVFIVQWSNMQPQLFCFVLIISIHPETFLERWPVTVELCSIFSWSLFGYRVPVLVERRRRENSCLPVMLHEASITRSPAGCPASRHALSILPCICMHSTTAIYTKITFFLK